MTPAEGAGVTAPVFVPVTDAPADRKSAAQAALERWDHYYPLMRKYQKLYFKNRTAADLAKAKQYAENCDRAHADLVDALKREPTQMVLL